MMKSEDHEENYMNNRDDDDDGDDGEGMMDGSGMREVEVREQDRFLPIANIARIMKTELPGNAKIAKDAKESIQECVSEFISFITSEASDKCLQEKRKTINGDDLLWAMSTLGFDKYIDPLKLYLTKYRDSVKGEKPEKKPSAASIRKNEGGSSGGNSGSNTSSNLNAHHHTNSAVGSLGASSLSMSNSGMNSNMNNLNNHSGMHVAPGSSSGLGMNMNLGMGMNMSSQAGQQMHTMSHQGGNINHGNGDVTGMHGNSNINNGNNMNMLPSVSNLSAYNAYDASGGLLMGGGIEASPLFLGAGGGKLGDSLLPPLPKKREMGPGGDMSSFPTNTAATAAAMNKKHKPN